MVNDLVNTSPYRPEIQQEMEIHNKEKKLVKNQAIKITKFEIRTTKDMAEALAEIQRIIEKNKNNLRGSASVFQDSVRRS